MVWWRIHEENCVLEGERMEPGARRRRSPHRMGALGLLSLLVVLIGCAGAKAALVDT
jgi:hypothetical protein